MEPTSCISSYSSGKRVIFVLCHLECLETFESPTHSSLYYFTNRKSKGREAKAGKCRDSKCHYKPRFFPSFYRCALSFLLCWIFNPHACFLIPVGWLLLLRASNQCSKSRGKVFAIKFCSCLCLTFKDTEVFTEILPTGLC